MSSRKVILVFAVVCILLTVVITYVSRPTTTITRDLVGIINIDGVIESSGDTKLYAAMINHVMLNESIKAVVLRVDCPGGSADLVESIFLDLLELKKTKTLVASLVFAASGGYYIAVAADYIYVEPSSLIGNVGVIGVAPSILLPSEVGLETGAYKATGFSELLFPFNLSRVLNNFVSAVEKGRGSRLKLTSSQLARGMIYLGTEALSVGLVDEVGSLQKAIGKAGERLAPGYGVVDLNQALYPPSRVGNTSQSWQKDWRALDLDGLNALHPPPSVWYLYMGPVPYGQNLSSPGSLEDISAFSSSTGGGKGEVLVDLSHGNRVSVWELNILRAELMRRNVTLRFIPPEDDLMMSLENATSLIVASPTSSYSLGESEEVRKFVARGGLLLLFYDPAYEYSGRTLFEPINSLSTYFGIAYGSGYLYNQEEHYGFYRNICVKTFGKSFITQNVSSLVFFTAAHIYSSSKGVAWTTGDTYSSVAERTGNYTVISVVEGEGTVVAFGDFSFLREPNCYVADNYQLILNIVSALVDFSQKKAEQ